MINKDSFFIFYILEDLTKSDLDEFSRSFNNAVMKGEKNFILDIRKCTNLQPIHFNDINIIANRAKKNLANFAILGKEHNHIDDLIKENKFNSNIPYFYSFDEIIESFSLIKKNGLKYFTMEMAFSGEMDNLPRIREFIWSVLHNLPLSEDESNLVVLSIDEAVANIMKYAYRGNGEKHLVIQAQYKSPDLRFLIIDNGEEFDPTDKEAEELNVNKYITEGHHGGLGIFIIEQVMDRFNHFYVPGMGNRLILEKKVGKSENSSS
ncbi:ATP-binding protein [bacterium]|nr:ATP-binding protein [bacterium]